MLLSRLWQSMMRRSVTHGLDVGEGDIIEVDVGGVVDLDVVECRSRELVET